MTPAVTPKFTAWLTLASTALFAGLVLGRPELVAIAAPLLVVLLVGTRLSEPPRSRSLWVWTRRGA